MGTTPTASRSFLLGEAARDDSFRRCGDRGFAPKMCLMVTEVGLASSDLFDEHAAATSTPAAPAAPRNPRLVHCALNGARLTHHQRDAESNHCDRNQTVEDPPRQRVANNPASRRAPNPRLKNQTTLASPQPMRTTTAVGVLIGQRSRAARRCPGRRVG